MIGFINFIEKDGNYIGGYLGTDEELMPMEFAITDHIKLPDALQKILHGAQCDMKWFGDQIAGTLFEGAQKTRSNDDKQIQVLFVADERMLHLRRKTGDIPVAYITSDERIVVHTEYPEDKNLVDPILKRVRKYSNLAEVLDRIEKGIEEKISSTSRDSL